jgi:hypothetical protein
VSSCLLLALVLAAPGIASNSDCPSSRAIESNLSLLLPGGAGPPGTVRVVGLPDRLLVELSPDGPAGSSQRAVAVEGDCEERARAAAILIATWWPTASGEQPRPEAPRLEAPVALPRLLTQRKLGLSAGGLVSAVSDGVTPGARAEVSLAWQRLGFRVALSGTGPQGGSLGRGKADWWRLSGESGPTYGAGRWRVDAGLVASAFFVQGSSFAENQRSTGYSVGATAGLRVAGKLGPMLPWLELRGIWWPASQRIYVLDRDTGIETSRPMPHGEIQLAAGVALSLL